MSSRRNGRRLQLARVFESSGQAWIDEHGYYRSWEKREWVGLALYGTNGPICQIRWRRRIDGPRNTSSNHTRKGQP